MLQQPFPWRNMRFQHLNVHPSRELATRCNTLQHTATHCNTLQHTATHCNTLCNTLCNTPSNSLSDEEICGLNIAMAIPLVYSRCNTLQHILQHTLQQPFRWGSLRTQHSDGYPSRVQARQKFQACQGRGCLRHPLRTLCLWPWGIHCNTLQHTATTHCNTLQHTATHCTASSPDVMPVTLRYIYVSVYVFIYTYVRCIRIYIHISYDAVPTASSLDAVPATPRYIHVSAYVCMYLYYTLYTYIYIYIAWCNLLQYVCMYMYYTLYTYVYIYHTYTRVYCMYIYVCISIRCIRVYIHVGWLRLVGSLKL